MKLDNQTKIHFCNAFDAMEIHRCACHECELYLTKGDGDLCDKGKDIIAKELAYADTKPDLSESV